MKFEQITRDKFREIFINAPAVLEADYSDIAMQFWINDEAKFGVKVVYKYPGEALLKQYYAMDLTAIYSEGLRNYAMTIYNRVTEKLEVAQWIVEDINFAMRNNIINTNGEGEAVIKGVIEASIEKNK